MPKNGATRHEKALLIDFIRYQREEINQYIWYQRKETNRFIRCYRINNADFIFVVSNKIVRALFGF